MSASYWLQQLVIGWLTFHITGSPILTTIALGLDMVPFLFLSPVGGILADRWDRRYVMAATSVYQASLTAVLGVLEMTGHVGTWHIMAYALGVGMSFPFIDPARVALVARVVPRESLINAFALSGLAQNASRLAFPFIGGLSIAFFGPGETLLAAAVLYAAVAGVALSITGRAAARTVSKRRSAVQEFREAARYARGQPVVLGILLIGVLLPVMYVPSVNRMMPVYASEVFGVGPAGLGLLMGSIGVGSTLGTIALAVLGDIGRKGRVITAALVLAGFGMLAFSRLDNLAAGIPVLMLLSGIVTVYWTMSGATVQLVVSDEFRGRVSSLTAMSMGLFPLGSLVFGGIAQAHGAQTATAAAGVTLAVCTVLLSLRLRAVFEYR